MFQTTNPTKMLERCNNKLRLKWMKQNFYDKRKVQGCPLFRNEKAGRNPCFICLDLDTSTSRLLVGPHLLENHIGLMTPLNHHGDLIQLSTFAIPAVVSAKITPTSCCMHHKATKGHLYTSTDWCVFFFQLEFGFVYLQTSKTTGCSSFPKYNQLCNITFFCGEMSHSCVHRRACCLNANTKTSFRIAASMVAGRPISTINCVNDRPCVHDLDAFC